MKKIVSIVGARPQFIKAAALSRVLRKTCSEILVHTGQHYDTNMSAIFFDRLNIPRPDYDLEVGSGSHGKQTGLMMQRLEDVLLNEKPELVLIYGDTNSTLAGALCASKLHIPLAHVEAGLRSYNWQMPEEINRVLADRCSQLLFCPTEAACTNLEKENITKGVYWTGDVMYDAALYYAEWADKESDILSRLHLSSSEYMLCTIHRASNTDQKGNLSNIVHALTESAKTIVFPAHPRTMKLLKKYDLLPIIENSNIKLIEPVDYLDMIQLEKNAKMIITDSGGVQKEAYFYQVPCITLREETEWVETIIDGWNRLVGSNMEKILEAMEAKPNSKESFEYYGKGNACDNILQLIHKNT